MFNSICLFAILEHMFALFLLARCAVITEFARETLARRGVKVLVPGEKEKVVVSLSDEMNDVEEAETEPTVTVTAGEKCEVRPPGLSLQCNCVVADFIASIICPQ